MYNKEQYDNYYKIEKNRKKKLASNKKWRDANPEKFELSRRKSIARSIHKKDKDNIYLTEVL